MSADFRRCRCMPGMIPTGRDGKSGRGGGGQDSDEGHHQADLECPRQPPVIDQGDDRFVQRVEVGAGLDLKRRDAHARDIGHAAVTGERGEHALDQLEVGRTLLDAFHRHGDAAMFAHRRHQAELQRAGPRGRMAAMGVGVAGVDRHRMVRMAGVGEDVGKGFGLHVEG